MPKLHQSLRPLDRPLGGRTGDHQDKNTALRPVRHAVPDTHLLRRFPPASRSLPRSMRPMWSTVMEPKETRKKPLTESNPFKGGHVQARRQPHGPSSSRSQEVTSEPEDHPHRPPPSGCSKRRQRRWIKGAPALGVRCRAVQAETRPRRGTLVRALAPRPVPEKDHRL